MYHNGSNRKNIYVFHDVDNVHPLDKEQEEYLLQRLIRFVQQTGYVQHYYSFLSNPQRQGYEADLRKMLEPLDIWDHRFSFVSKFRTPNSHQFNEIDYVLCYRLRKLYHCREIQRGDAVVIVSGDLDFYSDNFLKKEGIEVKVLSMLETTAEPLKKYRI